MNRGATLVVPGDPASRTGGYEYDRQMARALHARGWTIDVATVPDGYPIPDAIIRRRVREVLARIADGRPVLVDGLAMGVLPDEMIAEASRLRLVALVHHPLAREAGLSGDLALALFQSERRALRAARHIVVTSPSTAEALAEYGVPPGAVSVVLPGTMAAEMATGSGEAQPRLLCVGSVIPRKGHRVLVEALGRLRDVPWTLRCVGSLDRDPVTAAAVRARATALSIGGRMQFLGELSEQALAEEYRRADLFVLPTLYEGYGMVVAEAVARGLPVVASDTGGIGQLLGRDAGIAVAVGDVDALTDALRHVLSDTSARARLAEGARRTRSHLPTWLDAADVMSDVLARVAA